MAAYPTIAGLLERLKRRAGCSVCKHCFVIDDLYLCSELQDWADRPDTRPHHLADTCDAWTWDGQSEPFDWECEEEDDQEEEDR